MKKLLLLTVAILLSNFSFATNHTVSTLGMTFTPSALTINIGDSVTFINTGGFHNVNGTTATFPSNPAGFSNPTGISSGWTYMHVFTVPGTYNYQCDPHVPGMAGTITVGAQQTYVPDDNFETYLEANGMGNGIANDDNVTTANINAVTTLQINSQSISNLIGIEDFTALTELWCNDNQLTSLDVSNNTALTDLNCSGNQLTNLNVSANTVLTTFGCSYNQLTSLDVTQNTALVVFYCPGNQLTSLDVSQNTILVEFDCSENQLTSLDVRNGNNINMGFMDMWFEPGIGTVINPYLTCINVDDSTFSANFWTTNSWFQIDPQHYFSNNCSSLIYGCTDSFAINYDSLATIDDSSCVYCDLSIDSLAVTQMTCFTWNNADVQVFTTGSQPTPYLYTLYNEANPLDTIYPLTFLSPSPQGNVAFSALYALTYVVYVEDNLGCFDSDTFTINSIDSVYIDSVTYSNVSCNGMANGYISAIIPMGGTPPYQFSLNGGPLYPTGYVFSGLTPGTYTVEIWDSNMCANSYTFIITEPPPIIWQQAFSICDGDSVMVGSSVYSTNGNYIDTLTAGNGCDSIVYTNVSISSIIWNQTYLICDGDSIVVGSSVYDTSGAYMDTLNAANGCDSIVHTYIAVDQNTSSYDTVSVTLIYVWNGITFTTSGDYFVTLTNSAGCDSIAYLNLTITNTTGLLDVTNTEKTLLKITDILGQETPYRRNTPLFYIYDDGTVEKRITID